MVPALRTIQRRDQAERQACSSQAATVFGRGFNSPRLHQFVPSKSKYRVMVELIEAGLDAREREKREFLELAERLAQSSNSVEQERLKEELARITFGE